MRKQHEELLETLQAADKQARALHGKGCNVDAVISGLRQLENYVAERLRSYPKEAAAKSKKIGD